jgi:hypothetical protein
MVVLSIRRMGLSDRGPFQHEISGSMDDCADTCHPLAAKVTSRNALYPSVVGIIGNLLARSSSFLRPPMMGEQNRSIYIVRVK